MYSTNELGDVLAKIVKTTGCDLAKKGRIVLARDTRCGLYIVSLSYNIIVVYSTPDQVERD